MRILAIDFGSKRTGIAVTDPLQIIASALVTVPTAELFVFLKKYVSDEQVERFVVGAPFHEDGNPAQMAAEIDLFCEKIGKMFPEIAVSRQDERFTSNMAKAIMLQNGMKKKDRRDKNNVDKIAAAIILESWMYANKW
jgi:putative holliday junction resolvase